MGPLTNEQWNKLYAIKDDCYGSHDYGSSKSSSMTTIISCGKARLCFQQFRTGNFLAIISKDYDIHGNYKLNDDAMIMLHENIFSQVGGIWSKRLMSEQFCKYVSLAKMCLVFSGIIEDEIVKEMKEESEMEEKKMNIEELVEAANKAAEAEVVDAVEVQQKENNNEKEEVVMSKENEKVQEQVIEEQVAQETVAKKLANELMLHKADDSEIVIKANVIKNVDKDGKAINTRGKIMGFSDKLKKQVEIGSFVIGGGYSLPIFMIKCRGLKDEVFKPVRNCDKENRTVNFHGSKNYFVLLSLLMNKEEIEQAKAAEIARFFPPIRERSESKGVEKNLSVTVAIDGETVSLTGWVQREWRPLYLENEDRTITVRWDFDKGYQDPSIKFRGKMLRKNHDGISGNVKDAEIFEAIKDAIEDVLKG